ncbi:hypothetical protein LguiB_005464 [Lonicera macranthoides]
MMVMSKTSQRRFLLKTAKPCLPIQEQPSINHTLREGNKCTDKLARYGVLEREMEDAGILIELLVRYSMGLELFEDLDTLANTINRVSSLVDDLRSSYLLLGEGNNVFVIMHDVVRDVVLSIASDPHGYMVRHDRGSTEWPEKDKCTPHTASLLYSDEMLELPVGLDLPNPNLLRVACWQRNVEILEEFFELMKQLKVFHFCFFGYVNSPPTSFRFLTNLRALFLEHCRSLPDLSFDWWGENSLSFCGVDRILILENNINALLRRTKKLALESVRDLKNVVKDLNEQEGFVHLETLELEKCDELEYVMARELF